MATKILVTPRSITKNGHPALGRLEEAGYQLVFSPPGIQPGEDELCALLPGCVGYLAGVEKVTERVLTAASDLKVISRNGTGIDNIDLIAAERHGIQICRAEGANARGVAELAIGLMLALARQIPYSDAAIKRHGWERRQGMELESKTIGVIGCGKIGRQVAHLALAFGASVLAYDLFPDPNFLPSYIAGEEAGVGFRYAALEEIYAQADIITLHCPPPAAGKPLIDMAAIGQMKPGVYLVNTARSDLFDNAAILAGIEAGHISGVAIDVFDSEPPQDDALAASDRVIATPHIGGYTEESVERAVTVAVENILEALR